jgi:pSer/pThr/pTyr-binding forkhead associated (FHA) protein
MNQLDRLESLAQRLVEGSFNRLFPGGPPPAEEPDSAPPPQTREVLSLSADIEQAKRWSLRHEERRLELGSPVINLGRALDNDLVFPELTVSRYHAQLRWRGGRYYVYPPAPAEGNPATLAVGTRAMPAPTVINGRVLGEEPRPLANGDVIHLGKVVLTVLVG